jgi:N-acetylmuramoyl-L-alanine amidase
MWEQNGFVLHIAEGYYEGTIAWQMNPASGVSSHFIVAKDGRITQMVDTAIAAWTQRGGNGYWLSIEFEGFVPDPLTAAQLEAAARLFRKGHEVYGYPLQVTDTPYGEGLGHHSMGAECGVDWGHSECPGEAIKAQKPEIVARAKGDDVGAQDVWSWDIDPSNNIYSAGGVAWTVFKRTDYLANTFAPQVIEALDEQSQINQEMGDRMHRLGSVLVLMAIILVIAIGTLAGVVAFG